MREVFGLGYTFGSNENSVDTSRWYSEEELWSPGYEDVLNLYNDPWKIQKCVYWQNPTTYKNEDGNIRFKVWANYGIYLEVKQANGSWESYSHWLMRSGKKTVEQQNVVDAKPGKIIAGGSMNISGNKWPIQTVKSLRVMQSLQKLQVESRIHLRWLRNKEFPLLGMQTPKVLDNGGSEKFAAQGTNCWNGSESFYCLQWVESVYQQGNSDQEVLVKQGKDYWVPKYSEGEKYI